MRVFETYASQQFSLPHPIINYVLKSKRSPVVYEKLIQTCKYFFNKNPVIVLDTFCEYKMEKGLEKYFINEIDQDQKYWICVSFGICAGNNRNMASMLIPNIYKCDIEKLYIDNQQITYEEYMKLIGSGNVTDLSILYTEILYNNGELVPLEAVVEKLNDIKMLRLDFSEKNPVHWFTSATIQKLNNLSCFNNLTEFSMHRAPTSFNIEEFEEFINKHPQSSFHIVFENRSFTLNEYNCLYKLRSSRNFSFQEYYN